MGNRQHSSSSASDSSSPLPKRQKTLGPELKVDSPTSIWALGVDVLKLIVTDIDPKQLLRCRVVSPLWKHNLEHQEFWRAICSKTGSHYSYESRPQNWLQYWIFCHHPYPKSWPFKEQPTVDKGCCLVTHCASKTPIHLERIGPTKTKKKPTKQLFNHVKQQRRVFGVYNDSQNRLWAASSVVTAFPIKSIEPTTDYQLSYPILATIAFSLLQAKNFDNQNFLSSSDIFITKSGLPYFQTQVDPTGRGGVIENEEFFTGSGTGSEVEDHFLEAYMLPLNLRILLDLICYAHQVKKETLLNKLKWAPVESFKSVAKSVLTNADDDVIEFLWNYQTPEKLLHSKFIVVHADPSYKILKKIFESNKVEEVLLGPFTGKIYVETHVPQQLHDCDYHIQADDSMDGIREFGFKYDESFLTEDESNELIKNIESGEWADDREGKRVQVFGYNYLIPAKDSVGIPDYMDSIRRKLKDSGYGEYDQLIISEYLSGVGLRPHIDRLFWDDSIIGISLLSKCDMHLKRVGVEKEEKVVAKLNPGSLYQLKGESRYHFSHAIPMVEERRISLTFRNLAKGPVALPPGVSKVIKH